MFANQFVGGLRGTALVKLLAHISMMASNVNDLSLSR
jgi:hypothetical protein